MSQPPSRHGSRDKKSRRRSKSRERNPADIRVWLLPVFGILLVLELVLAFSTVRFWRIQRTAVADQQRLFHANESLSQARQASEALARLSFQATTAPDPRNLSDYRDRIFKKSLADSRDQPSTDRFVNPLIDVGHTLRSLESATATLGDTERRRFERLSAEFESLLLLDEKLLATLEGRFEDDQGRFTVEKEPDPALARDLLRDQSYQIRRTRLNDDIASMRAALDVRILSLLAAIKRNSIVFFPLALAATALLLVGTPLLGWFLHRHISKSIDTHKKQIRTMNDEFSRLRGHLSALELERNELQHRLAPPSSSESTPPPAESPAATPHTSREPSPNDLPASSGAFPAAAADDYLTRMP
jgi:hypothetical protein